MTSATSTPESAIDKALKAITSILFDGKSPSEIDFESQNANEVVNLQLKKAWINWILGDVDTIIEKINLAEIDGKPYYDAIPAGEMSLNARVALTGQSSRETAYKLAYEIEPKLRMIKDVQRALEKLDYLAKNKNDPDYQRCAFNLNTTLQYLMSDVQPQLEQFLNITDINQSLAGIEQSLVPNPTRRTHMFGGKRRRKSSKKKKHTRKGKKEQVGGKRHKKKGAKRRRGSRRHRGCSVRRRSAKPFNPNKVSW